LQQRRGRDHTAFITDAFSLRIVGWKVSRSLSVEVALDTLEKGPYALGC
jgi:transposase InsO family protein